MATKSTNGKSKAASTKVTRIKASESAKTKQKDVVTVKTADEKRPNALRRLGGYFKGAWQELKLVRWPTRRATWSLTGAVLVFSAFFVIVILLLDVLFKYLFELILV